MITQQEIKEAIEGFVFDCQKMIDAHYAEHLSNLTPPKLIVAENPRYWRIIRTESGTGRSVYCFVDPMTGDVLKADGWKRPAKGARGNLFDDTKGMSRMTVYGAGYNR